MSRLASLEGGCFEPPWIPKSYDDVAGSPKQDGNVRTQSFSNEVYKY